MASSVSGQNELATRAGKMELSCQLGITRRVPQEKLPRKPYNESFLDKACLGSFFQFCEFEHRDGIEVHKDAKKELGQYPAISTSHLVNKP